MKGKFYGIGVGSGDPELITIKAVNILKKCDFIFIPKTKEKESTAFSIIKDYINKDCTIEELTFSMNREKEERKQSRLNAAKKVISILEKGIDAAFITLGDATIYSTCMYLHEIIQQNGFETEIVSGIPSFCAVSAKLKISISEENESFGILPVSDNLESISKTADIFDNLILMKANKNINKICELLQKKGFSYIQGIEKCGLEGEKVLYHLAELEESSYFTTLIAKKERRNANG